MKSKKVIALTVSLLMGATMLGGCMGEEIIDSSYDATKAYLSVGTYAGGVGKAWLDDAARRYEELHKDTIYGDKKGIQISVDADKVIYGGANLQEQPLTKDLYFTEGVNYYTFVERGKAADLTDIMTEPLTEYNETKSIEDKLETGIKDYMKAKDGNYYMIPFYDGFYGFIYDVDLFEEEGFYFNDDGDFVDGLDKDAPAEDREAFEESKSNGPDGKDGTYDDGLPATYAQMLTLVDEISRKSYIPFCYAGSTEYVDKAFRGYISDYEGYEGMRINYTLNGKANIVTSINGDTVTTAEIDVTPANAYELQKQAGKYYALKMEEQLFGTTKYIGGSTNTLGHTETQRKFILSKYSQTERYAILAEGVWWENEADAVFQEIEVQRNEKKTDRRFSFMPVPKANENITGDQTMISLNKSFGFVNKDSQNLELAKDFMRFLHTDAEMSKFSAKTSIPRSLNYTVSAEDRETATNFGKSLIDMRATAKVVYPYSSAKLVLQNPSSFEEVEWFSTTKIDKDVYIAPLKLFQAGTVTAKQYFDGLYSYQAGKWSTLKND